MDLGRRTVVAALLLVAALLSPLTSVATATAAGATWHGPHHLPQPLLVAGRAVSCPTSSWCMAVDLEGHGQRFDGRRWRPPVPATRHFGRLMAVSCPTRRFCMAVGGDHYAVYRGSGWRRPRALPVNAVYGRAVSCSSSSFCMAVGISGHSVRWNGRRWTDVRTVDPHRLLAYVTCASPTMCLAAGAGGGGRTFRYGRHGWRSAGSPFAGAGRYLEGVALSCVSTSWCLGTTVGPFDHHLRAVYDGHHWGAYHRIAGRGQTTDVSCASSRFCVVASGHQLVSWHGRGVGHASVVGPHDAPASVACGAVGRCVASGPVWGVGAPRDDHSYMLRAGTWRRLNDTRVTDPDGYPDASCVTSSWCVVATGSRRTWVDADRTWRRVLLPDNASTSTPSSGTGRVSCTSSTFCALLQDDLFRLWNGTSWSTGTEVSGATWNDVACAAPTMCLAVGQDDAHGGETTTWNGTSWSPATALSGAPTLTSVACPAADHCLAGDMQGMVHTLDSGTWSAQPVIEPGDVTEDMESLSCPTTTFCAVIGTTDVNKVAVLQDGAWHRVPTPVGDDPSLSCPTDGTCVLTIFSYHQGSQGPRLGAREYSWQYSMGTGFTDRQRIDPAAYLARPTAVSCAGSTSCLAVDGTINAFELR